ncbi:MAG: SHOCT domain-containing protein, partial [Methanomassiliicoccaceae archaeon]|nr:SHOCT domain-containing protein [Methanomassiliicoccaceae archaeon]
KPCIGCGKATGAPFGAYTVKLLYGEVCLTCNKKLNDIPSYQYLTPAQIKDVISGRVQKSSVRASTQFAPQDESPSTQASSADEIRKYKELMDDGIITREEFEAVKKRLLGL